jgi:predicted metal-binding membrane protein
MAFVVAVFGALTMTVAHDREWVRAFGMSSVGAIAWAGAFLLGWTAMTVTMMLPSAVPFISVAHRLGGWAVACCSTAGFALVWVGVGVVAGAMLWLSGDWLARLPPDALEALAAGTLFIAGAYQLTPWAHSCRRNCARPFAIFARRWRSGARHIQASLAGVDYGVSCVGCCVPMIAVMVFIGVSDLLWMVLLALLMVAQKDVAWRRRHDVAIAALLCLGGMAMTLGWWSPSLHTLRSLCTS